MIPCPVCRRPMPQLHFQKTRLRQFCSRRCSVTATNSRRSARDAYLDEVAVIRLTTGSPVTSTKAERLEAVRLLIGRGYSTAVVAERLHTTTRSVWRYRAELTNRKAVA